MKMNSKNDNEFPSAWRCLRIEDCMSAIIDYRGKTPHKTSYGVPLVTAKIVKGGRILPHEEYISPDDYDDWMRRGMPEPGDIVITTEAPLGEIAQLDNQKVALAQRLITLRGLPDLLDNTYLKFAMQSKFVQDQIRSRESGTTVLGIKQSELRLVELPVPPIPEQRVIAQILGTLDDIIENNRRMNETLEAMSRAIFKSWFVDFDPVHAKSAGRKPSSMNASTAALFPNSFVDSALGDIPKGWKVGHFGDVAENPRRGVGPSEIVVSTPYIALEHMPRKCIALSEWAFADGVASGKFKFHVGEILFGKLRPYFHKVGIAAVEGVCSTDILVIIPKKVEWQTFVLAIASSDELVQHADATSTGTKMPRTNWSDIASYEIVLPSEILAAAYDEMTRPMTEAIITNIHQSRTLAAIRDALLPKLLAGEISIRIVERFVEEMI